MSGHADYVKDKTANETHGLNRRIRGPVMGALVAAVTVILVFGRTIAKAQRVRRLWVSGTDL